MYICRSVNSSVFVSKIHFANLNRYSANLYRLHVKGAAGPAWADCVQGGGGEVGGGVQAVLKSQACVGISLNTGFV